MIDVNEACDVIVNDLLCFVQNGMENSPADTLKPIAVEGLTQASISAARDILFAALESCEGHEAINIRKAQHRQTGKSSVAAMEVSDIFKVFVSAFCVGLTLPKFAAIHITRLPSFPCGSSVGGAIQAASEVWSLLQFRRSYLVRVLLFLAWFRRLQP